MVCHTNRRKYHLGQQILRYVSRLQDYERDYYYVLENKHRENILTRKI